MPVAGTINLLSNGYFVVALVVVALMALTVVLTVKERTADVMWPGAALAGVLIYVIAHFQYVTAQLRSGEQRSWLAIHSAA